MDLLFMHMFHKIIHFIKKTGMTVLVAILSCCGLRHFSSHFVNQVQARQKTSSTKIKPRVTSQTNSLVQSNGNRFNSRAGSSVSLPNPASNDFLSQLSVSTESVYKKIIQDADGSTLNDLPVIISDSTSVSSATPLSFTSKAQVISSSNANLKSVNEFNISQAVDNLNDQRSSAFKLSPSSASSVLSNINQATLSLSSYDQQFYSTYQGSEASHPNSMGSKREISKIEKQIRKANYLGFNSSIQQRH